MTDWQNRLSTVVKLIPANQLLANPSNPRRHPIRQREALRGSLDTLGFVAPILVSKRSQFMLDGHARVEEALSKDENTLVPVLEVDLEAHEESLFLASFDYITYMAEYDRDSLDALLRDVNTDDNRLQAMLSELAVSHGLVEGDNPYNEWVGMPEFEQETIKTFHNLIIHFKTEEDMNAFAELLGQVINKTTKYLYYPKQENDSWAKYKVENES